MATMRDHLTETADALETPGWLVELRLAAEDYMTAPGLGARGISQDFDRLATRRLTKALGQAVMARSFPMPGTDGLRRLPLHDSYRSWLRELLADTALTDREVSQLGDQLAHLVRCAELGRRATTAKTGDLILEAPWPSTDEIARRVRLFTNPATRRRVRPVAKPTVTPTPRPTASRPVTKAQVEEVARTYDPSLIELPEPNQASVMAWVQRLQAAWLQVVRDLAEERARGEAWAEVATAAADLDWTDLPR